MKTPIKLLIATGLLVIVPAVADSLAKDQARIPYDDRLVAVDDHGGPPAMPGVLADYVDNGPRAVTSGFGFDLPPQRLDPPRPDSGSPHGPAAAPHARPLFPPPPPDRQSCEDAIDRHAGMAGYIGSKLQLRGAQKEAWQKIEQAAEPVVDKMRRLCASIASEPNSPPSAPALIDMTEQQLSVRAELLRAIAGPVKALYDILSPQQRAILDRPPPRPF